MAQWRRTMEIVAMMEALSGLKGMKVLVTGHTGFKGAWLSIWLDMLGAELVGISLNTKHKDGIFNLSRIGDKMKDYRVDILHLKELKEIFASEKPEIVFHLAAQPLVLSSYQDPVTTFATNTMGTVHLLEAIRQTPSVKVAVMVTSDKCYENMEWIHGYRESDTIGGHDPYSASKGAAELVISAYRRSYFSEPGKPAIASVRAGNVIGGGDWSEYRLVPDIIRSIIEERPLDLRSPEAVRPWQHVLEPIGGYLLLSTHLLNEPLRYAQAWNFGPSFTNIVSVRTVVEAFFKHFGKGSWNDVYNPDQPLEAGLLTLEIRKSIHKLGWKPVLDLDETIQMTAHWYSCFQKQAVVELSRYQITQYLALWKLRNES